MRWPADSLESRLKQAFTACLLIPLACCALLLTVLPAWQVLVLAVLAGTLLWRLIGSIYRQTMAAFRRAGVQLDALQSEDYSLVARPAFRAGQVAEFHRQLDALGSTLQQTKSRYDQQLFVLYRLIDQLNTPILVFDHRLQLSYANTAFAQLFERPWQALRHASPELLGLIPEPEWQFVDGHRAQRWQIRHSHFFDGSQGHQLLVFIDIHSALRESQLQAWQKLIRVLSHEIRNSLTPVAALAQNLQTRTLGEREQQALELIDERCQHLQDFVSRYAELHRPLHVQPQWLDARALFQRMAALFPESQLAAQGLHLPLFADSILLQQVLINLIKNAVEADSPAGTIELIFCQRGNRSEIRVRDRGRGIANPDNLFVPFYSTKCRGQGIGLSLSRHIVEQMGGQLSLVDKATDTGGSGACAIIRLPLPLPQ
jgi:signal transduction histidine kinase